ncbi:MAG: lysophospholipid acyltransferase family protein [Candidatus Eremiobacteraeota bacterium]|nr:lysophospholipid acyltransferase family protein [Candidatus Eremiobacteraeota bacterium]MCW5869781.1 lysophospholipid acyltransferase family protein [Candidatus Eremiobacteraeota bacterium]
MLASFIYRLALVCMRALGWKFKGQKPSEKKFVLLGAPHTSNWDFFITLALIGHFDLPLRYMVKDQVFKGPWAGLLKSLGAIPIDRSRRVNVVDSTIEAIRKNDEIVIGILPEGTRKRTEYWKSGFYHIAFGAGVPVVLAKVDGPSKTLTLGPSLRLTGDIEADMAKIADYYKDAVAIFPDCFGPVRLKGETPQSSPDSAPQTDPS